MNKRTLVIGAVTAASVASIAGASLVSAQTANNGSGNTIIDKLATRFNLNRDEVKKVFDENHQAHEAEHQKTMTDRLNKAVSDGKLTQAQADNITAKLSEMKTFMDSLKDKTPQERHDAMETKRSELMQWAKDNNIPTNYLAPGGFGMGKGHRGMHGPDMDSDETPPASNNN